MPENAHRALVVGTGPTGLSAALALAQSDVAVTLTGPPNVAADRRTAALFGPSITFLQRLGVWEACADASAPISGIRLIDDTGGLLRAPEVVFRADEVPGALRLAPFADDKDNDGARQRAPGTATAVFGWNVPNAALTTALGHAVRAHPGIEVVTTAAITGLGLGSNAITAQTAEGQTLSASVVVAADGRHSVCRAAAGLAMRTWSYPQCALVCSFTHARAHASVSSELHRRAGPLTVVPLPGNASSLVWVERTEIAERLAAYDDAAFRLELERHLQGLLGSIGEISPRAVFPLSGLTAEHFAARRVLLVGESAHVFPPIGAQGLNLGMRDVATLVDVVSDAVTANRDPGGRESMAAYDAARRGDIGARTLAVDLLNRSLLAGLLPVDLMRGAALHLVDALEPLRQAVVRAGLQPPGTLPRLMRPRDA